nr:hypothetical protein CFP56_58574 [Quercus suber]
MVNKKDIEDLNKTMAERNNNSITPYEGLDVPHHNFNYSIEAAVEGFAVLNLLEIQPRATAGDNEVR